MFKGKACSSLLIPLPSLLRRFYLRNNHLCRRFGCQMVPSEAELLQDGLQAFEAAADTGSWMKALDIF